MKNSTDTPVEYSHICPICGSTQQAILFEGTDINWETTDERFSVVRCNSCGIVRTAPQPSIDQLKKYYPDVYYTIEDLSEDYYVRRWKRFQIEKLKIVQQYHSGGKLLDIGCGRGYFLYEARSAGYNVAGIEFSAQTAALAKSRWDLQIETADVVTYPYPPLRYDIVTLWHVFEHIADPNRLLQGLYNTLTSNGVLVIAVPNFAGMQARLFRGKWLHLDLPRHLYHYTPESLSGLVQKNGYAIRGISLRSQEYDAAGIFGSVWRRSPQSKSMVETLIRKIFGTTAMILSKVENVLNSGATVILTASKK
jgi:SAM-dependent methyltransferase